MVTPHKAKGGKKNRKFGRGIRKVQRSRFGSYANIFKMSEERKHCRMESRKARFARRAAKEMQSECTRNN